MIDDLISELAKRLAAERDDADLKHIYNKHSGSDFDAEETPGKTKKDSQTNSQRVAATGEEQQTSQSIRELYRKLASALHPDREPDPQERDRKTVLMQRINQAYNKNNLLLLLKLQLELEHIDQATIDNITAGRLKLYNKILKGQLNELEHEIFHTEDMFKTQFGISPFPQLSPSTIMRNLASDIVGVQHTIR